MLFSQIIYDVDICLVLYSLDLLFPLFNLSFFFFFYVGWFKMSM